MNPLFEQRMKEQLKDESEAFFTSMEQPLYQGVRLSALKQDPDKTKEELDFLEKPSPFAQNTWYVHGQHGLHPAHLQGLIYFQEPSAGSAVEALDVQDGDLVLDLCAAPGSKSTQILEKTGSGFLLSNEYDAKRAQILLSNLERMGAENFMVTNMDVKTLCPQLEGVFDKVLVDAPCSGEGMMKKHDAARDKWSLDNILLCADRQQEILDQAARTVKPGGVLVYSTCTYAPEENEQMAAWFLKEHPEFTQDAISKPFGRPGLETEGLDASLVRRIYPMDQGEGHFVARFVKKDEGPSGEPAIQKSAKLPKEAAQFIQEQKKHPFEYYLADNGKDEVKVYGMNRPFWKLKGKVLRQGVAIGSLIKNRFEPAHAFYLCQSMAKEALAKTETDLQQMDDFVHGMQISIDAPKGWRALCHEGIPYGFGKSSQKRITNKYPKGLRLLPSSHVEGSQDAGKN